jgi:hypothetical protein
MFFREPRPRFRAAGWNGWNGRKIAMDRKLAVSIRSDLRQHLVDGHGTGHGICNARSRVRKEENIDSTHDGVGFSPDKRKKKRKKEWEKGGSGGKEEGKRGRGKKRFSAPRLRTSGTLSFVAAPHPPKAVERRRKERTPHNETNEEADGGPDPQAARTTPRMWRAATLWCVSAVLQPILPSRLGMHGCFCVPRAGLYISYNISSAFTGGRKGFLAHGRRRAGWFPPCRG